MNNHTKVLVVDDDVEVCQILHRMLSDKEFQVQITQSVADAVQAIDERLFDVYLVDFNLEDGTGCDIGDRVRSKGSAAPIIVVSGYDPETVALKAGTLRLFDIIEKPFSRTRISDAVTKAMCPTQEKLDPIKAGTNIVPDVLSGVIENVSIFSID
jgi:DNA-binding NtrC family response regulator